VNGAGDGDGDGVGVGVALTSVVVVVVVVVGFGARIVSKHEAHKSKLQAEHRLLMCQKRSNNK
jgi:putative heme iron utilization protein